MGIPLSLRFALRSLATILLCLPAFSQSADVGDILKQHCLACHTGAKAQGKLSLDSATGIAKGGVSGSAIMAGNAESSPLYQRLIAKDANRMPPGAPLPAAKIEAIRKWIDEGAPGMEPAGEASVPVASASSQDVTSVDFARHVAPILSRNCYGCHSGSQPKSQLRLDVRAGVVKGGLGGPVIVAGDAEHSRLIRRIEGKDGEQRMPLKGDPLKDDEIALLRRWIDGGAKWPAGQEEAVAGEALLEKHWAYKKPVRPAVPKVKAQQRVRNPIDAFLLAQLEKEKLSFAPPASKETLIRRVSLDLTGLPPTLDEITSFVNDASPEAYHNLVDRLLASPHYGERWARPWLDLARYADTNGYEKDNRRTMWKYRDWVIQALNGDMGFDQFTVEQLAGDMLPNPTTEQKIATGFHRNTMYNEEGGVDKEEAHFEVLVDRVNTTATVWLASTMGCAQCHNHKYDPITQKDYYALMAFFAHSAKEKQQYGDTSEKWREPVLDLATPEQQHKRTELNAQIKALQEKLQTQTPALEREQAQWERQILESAKEWKALRVLSAASENGAVLTAQDDGAILASGENSRSESYVLITQAEGKRITGLRIEALPHASLPRGGPGRDLYGNFILTEVAVTAATKPVRFSRVIADDGRTNDARMKQLWVVDASKEDHRLPRQLILVFEEPLSIKREDTLEIRLRQDSEFAGQGLGYFRISASATQDPSWIIKVRSDLRPVLEKQAQQRSEDESKRLSAAFRNLAPSLSQDRDRLKELRSQLDRLGVVTALVMEEHPSHERPYDFLRTRGGFASKADKVYADVPAALGHLPESEMPNRLGLARWLVSKENPLTARVAVNRIWEQYFGRGLVETSEDFGLQGALPTHPDLLDWLALEFMEQGWSLKALHRLIVTSAAYQQDSRITPEILQADPYNKLISRGPRFRVEAEMVRDIALSAAGLLSRKVGGPSVFPSQPAGIWDLPYNDDKWVESEGEDKYRRGLYTFARRSAMYPTMMNFDATSREVCTVRRIRTNTPLQALNTLNDPAFFEAAQAMAARVLREGGAQETQRLGYAFRLATGREPSAAELERLAAWRRAEKSYFDAHAEEARKLAPTGDDPIDGAAWTMLSNVLLNLDETLTKE